MKKNRILMVIGSLDYCNGITSYAMNYYNNLIKDNFEIDFAVHYEFDTEYSKQVFKDGNHVYFMGNYSIKSMLGLSKRIYDLLQKNHYDIVHCHILNLAYFYFKQCKKNHIKCRILHSHATKNSDNVIKNIRNNIFKHLAFKYATHYFACSKLAGDYLFGKKSYQVIRNAIQYDRFLFSKDYRESLKEKHAIQDEVCLGFIGRFTAQKNIFFLIDIAKCLAERQFKFKLFLIGDGNLYSEISSKIEQNHLEKNIIVIESNPDAYQYYSLFDIFVLPSLFEGLPLTGVEAQVAGCTCLFSDKITNELAFTKPCSFLPINNPSLWVDKIIMTPIERNNKIPNDFNIENETIKMSSIYRKLMEEN